MNSDSHHISERELQLLVDGELGWRRTSTARRHLSTCWICRGHLAQRERLIGDFAIALQQALDSQLPPLSERRAALEKRLEGVARQPASYLGMSRGVFQLSGFRWLRPGWAAVATACGVVALWLVTTLNPPETSAQTLLSRASQAQEKAGDSRSQEVLIQALGRRWRRRIAVGANRSARSARDAMASEYEGLLRTARIDPDDPLSAASFASWRTSLPHRRDRVTRRGEFFDLLTSDVSSGQVAWAQLTVRSADFWPTGKRVTLRSGEVVVIEELAASPAVPAPVAGPSFMPAAPPEPKRSASPVEFASAEQLAEAELSARIALHSVAADRGEDVQIRRTAEAIEIAAQVDDEQRRRQIEQTLASIPHTHRTVSLIDVPAQSEPVSRMAPSASPVVARPAWSSQLAERFPDGKQREEYVRSVLEHIRAASSVAWALRHLSERYTDSEMALLSADGHRNLELLLASERRETASELAALAEKLSQFAAIPPPLRDPSPDWYTSAKKLTATLNSLQEHLMEALAGAADDTAGGTLHDTIARELATADGQVSAIKQSLVRTFHGSNSPEGKN
jgi:hypothetical protein